MTSYANMPSEDVIGNIDTTKFRDSDCLKNYLTLMGAMYFSEFDIQNKLISSSLDVRQEKFLSFGVFTYNADVKAAKETDYGATFDKTGSLEVDILDNTYIQKSYIGNAEDEHSFHFLSGLASSYLESEIVEQFTGESAVSTVSVLETAMDMDVPIICINSQNIDRLNSLGLYDEDKTIIREAVETGAYVTVPERNIKIDSWTGTGYIIQNEDTGDLTFKISGALNGGATPNKATQDALKKFALICGSVAFVDTVSALYSSVMMMSNAVMSLMFASSTLGVVGSVAVIGASIALMNAAMKSYQAAITNCFLVLEGNPEAAIELLIDTELTLIVNVLGELGGITASAIKNKIAKNYIKSSLPEELVPEIYKAFEGSEESLAKFMKKAKNSGIDTECLIKLLRDSGCIEKYSPKILKRLGKLKPEVQWAVIDGLEKSSLDKESLDKFFKSIPKDSDEVFEQLAKSADIEKATNCIVKYGDSASTAIAKHGDKAVELLDMFPSKECADILSNSSKELVDSISKLDKTAAENFINVVAKNEKTLIDSINNCSFVDDAVKMIAKFEDNGVDIFVKYKDKEVIGLSKSLDSSSSNAITFTECPNGKVYVAGSCNYDYNPTISVPDGYFSDKLASPSSDYYFEKYNQLLSKDYISKMEVSDSVKIELSKLTDAVEFTKSEALKANKYYKYGSIKEASFMTNRSVSNCAEIWAAREAILNGATFEDLTYLSVKSVDGSDIPMCKNCQHTFIEYFKHLLGE